jgi:NADH dehydrogenase
LRARIVRLDRNNAQIGSKTAADWCLEFPPQAAKEIDPLMGWTAVSDTQEQVRLRFATRDEAIAYARRHGIDAIVQPDQPRRPNIRPGGYGENFSTARREPWTH